MTVLQRAATIAVMSFSLAGLLGVSTPGLAAGHGQALAQQTSAQLRAEAFQLLPDQQPAPTAPPAVLVQPVAAAPQPVPAVIAPDQPRFDTLAAALAAQDASDADEATRCLASAIYFEAKGEPLDGQLAVADVIINRAGSGRFPPDVCAVVRQPGQFSFVHGGTIPAIDGEHRYYRTAMAVAKVAMAHVWTSSAPKALFFHARRVPPSTRWVKVAAIGNHVFYR